MGKTLTVLGLIISNPCKEHCLDVDKVYQQIQFQIKNPGKDYLTQYKNNPGEYYITKYRLKCTLLFVPVRIIDQWSIEISKYAPQLKVLVFSNIKGHDEFLKSLQSKKSHIRRNAYQRLVEADIVIVSTFTSMETLALINTFHVHRICLDEGHQRPFKCNQIMAQCKWIITATPFNGKNMKDIHCMVRKVENYLLTIHRSDKSIIFSINGTQNFCLQDLLLYFHGKNEIGIQQVTFL